MITIIVSIIQIMKIIDIIDIIHIIAIISIIIVSVSKIDTRAQSKELFGVTEHQKFVQSKMARVFRCSSNF